MKLLLGRPDHMEKLSKAYDLRIKKLVFDVLKEGYDPWHTILWLQSQIQYQTACHLVAKGKLK